MKAKRELLMTEAEGLSWHEFKATLGPIYPGYESFDKYMTWMRERLHEYGCIDTREHHWVHETYRVNDWPDHESGAMGLVSDGREVPVGTFLMLSGSTGEEGLTAPLAYWDMADGEPEDGAFEGKIAVISTLRPPEKPYTEEFMASYVITDTNYRSDPEPPAPMLEMPDATVNNSWNTRWDFFQWGKVLAAAQKGGASALVVASNLTYGCVRGIYDRQKRHDMPAIVIDRVSSVGVIADAKAGKIATVKLVSSYYDSDAWNFVTFMPGCNYGTDDDEYITVNVHTDAMSLTQDNGSLGALGIARYFSNVPQAERKKTILFCVDSRHFIEGYEQGNFQHDPYQVWPELQKKITVTIGMEHMGELEGAEDYENNTMVCTGRPEFTFMKADDNDYCARILIQAAIDSGLERADIKIDGRPGIHGKFKGWVRAIQASCHKLKVCVIGQAGNWPGAHTQIFSTLQYFSPKKFRDEVHLWTQVVCEMMEVPSVVYHIAWSDLNTAIRKLRTEGIISEAAKEGLISGVSSVFSNVESGDYGVAASRLEREIGTAIREITSEDEGAEAIAALDRVLAVLR